MDQISNESQSRWFRPSEICEILRNYHKFHISTEPDYKPPSGSIFLFDRKVSRYFRKDGHNWKKKKDGKTVKEAHERLKAGSVDVLHCYYAHGEANVFFQRRSYWMLEENFSHIVLVHYRLVKGNRSCIPHSEGAGEPFVCVTKRDESLNGKMMYNILSSSFERSYARALTNSASTTSSQASEIEDTESGSCEGKFTQSSALDFCPYTLAREPCKGFHEQKWQDTSAYHTGVGSLLFTSSRQSIQSDILRKEVVTSGKLSEDVFGRGQETCSNLSVTEDWLFSPGNGLVHDMDFPIDSKFLFEPSKFADERESPLNCGGSHHDCSVPIEQLNQVIGNTHEAQHIVGRSFVKLDPINDLYSQGKSNIFYTTKKHLFDVPSSEVLPKMDSFEKWMSDELGDVDDSRIDSTSTAYWEGVESGDVVDDTGIATEVHLEGYSLPPSLSQHQLFSIIDFSPSWTYEGAKSKVLIMGKFLKHDADVANCEWSCMFGEVEVPVELVSDDVLRCWTPLHKTGRVPFYVTSSNRIACSEVREFEYRVNPLDHIDTLALQKENNEDAPLIARLINFLTLEACTAPYLYETDEKSDQIISLLMIDYDELPERVENGSEDETELLQKLLKLKLLKWLLIKVKEGGRGPNVLDNLGLGVLHLVASLGYHWAIAPLIISGGNVNFRDVNGWTGLHWAAFLGRERTVGALVSQGAAPGALTDPIPSYRYGRTPADLASANGHKGIAGYLAEAALSAHLSSLNVEDSRKFDVTPASAASKCNTAPWTYSDSSYKDPLTAVCNATQAAARIHQVFRVQSFQRKQLKELTDHSFDISEESALSLFSLNARRRGHPSDSVHDAVTRIQNKYRSYKGRKEFLMIRERVVKIQAHVRGYQVRKNYRKIIWSVGIMEKVILRWRRKGSGLRGFKSEALPGGSSRECSFSEEDEFDFLREGRKQTEQRLQKALSRVKSMVQYPEARDQYKRLLTAVTEIQATKVGQDGLGNTSMEADNFDDDVVDIEALLDENICPSEDRRTKCSPILF